MGLSPCAVRVNELTFGDYATLKDEVFKATGHRVFNNSLIKAICAVAAEDMPSLVEKLKHVDTEKVSEFLWMSPDGHDELTSLSAALAARVGHKVRMTDTLGAAILLSCERVTQVASRAAIDGAPWGKVKPRSCSV